MHFVNRLFRSLSRLLEDLLSLLFPNLCCACGLQLYRGETHLCTGCLNNLPYTDHHTDPQNKAARKLWGRIQFDAAMAMLHFKKGSRVQNIIHHLKYGNNSGIGVQLGMMMAEKLQIATAFEQIDLIIPVPLHKKKEWRRGYNQSKSIADGIAAVLGVPVNHTTLIRKIATESQTNKNRFGRYENMKDVFKIMDEQVLHGKHVLLVDDVITTGATIESCANELNKCGLKKLSIAAAALAD
ncbi:MAG: ComF family protein [Pedobacter sp.]|nr:MAG: ComF family protein [Pedobacter sp.]